MRDVSKAVKPKQGRYQAHHIGTQSKKDFNNLTKYSPSAGTGKGVSWRCESALCRQCESLQTDALDGRRGGLRFENNF